MINKQGYHLDVLRSMTRSHRQSFYFIIFNVTHYYTLHEKLLRLLNRQLNLRYSVLQDG